MINSETISRDILDWYQLYGRHDLPWQHPRTPYRIWLAEIMLQQTQVNTVIPYYHRFLQAFPDINTLANAPLDQVLHLWTGLGYYARARNLHKSAQIIFTDYEGQFPECIDQVQALPGIGRSTAGAILAQAFNQRHPILDGNVKRVLCRLHAIEGWPGQRHVEQLLWTHAERYTPHRQVADYTQAIMDLGATVCTRRRPHCATCPLQTHCHAYATDQVSAYPTPKTRKALPNKQTIMLLIQAKEQCILLEQRPPSGIWGGLWSLPECPVETDIQQWCLSKFNLSVSETRQLPAIRHTFSHYHLDIQPVHARAEHLDIAVMESPPRVWYNTQQPDARGLPAPVKQLLDNLDAIVQSPN